MMGRLMAAKLDREYLWDGDLQKMAAGTNHIFDCTAEKYLGDAHEELTQDDSFA